MNDYIKQLCLTNKQDTFRKLYEKKKFILYEDYSCNVVCKGNLEFLQYLETIECPITIRTVWFSIQSHNIDLIQYLFEKEYHKVNTLTECVDEEYNLLHCVRLAIDKDNLETLIYLHETQNIPLEYYHSSDEEEKNLITELPFLNDSVDILDYLVKKGCPIYEESFEYCIDHDAIKCILYFVKLGYTFDYKEIREKMSGINISIYEHFVETKNKKVKTSN